MFLLHFWSSWEECNSEVDYQTLLGGWTYDRAVTDNPYPQPAKFSSSLELVT